jgi:hypothetical protein
MESFPSAWPQVDVTAQNELRRRAAELDSTIEVEDDPWMGGNPQRIVMNDVDGGEDARWAG